MRSLRLSYNNNHHNRFCRLVLVILFACSYAKAFCSIHYHRHHLHIVPYPSELFYAATKDASIVEANKEYLLNMLGFTEDKVQIMNETTNILTLDVGVLEERVNWLCRHLSLDDYNTNANDDDGSTMMMRQTTSGTGNRNYKQLMKIIQHQPHILGKRPDTNIGPTIDYLQNRLHLTNYNGNENENNDDASSLRKLILSAPHILACSVELNIKPKLDYLQQRLTLTDAQLCKMITRQPYTLGCSILDNIEPTISWLQRRLHVNDSTISKMIRSNPQIMHLNIESNLDPTISWLQTRLALNDVQVGKVIQRMPQILGLSIDDNIEPKLDWVQEALCLDDVGLSKFVSKSVLFISCNIESNLEPTLNFYVNAMMTTMMGEEEKGEKNEKRKKKKKQEVLELLVNNPSLFHYSLENRLKPRLEEARDIGMDIDSTASLRKLGQYTDDEWYKMLILYMVD